jgi:hypothetical protein
VADDFPYSMTADEFRYALERLEFADPEKPGDEGISACGRFFGVSPRAAQDWARKGPPNNIAVCLRMMMLDGYNNKYPEVAAALAKAQNRIKREKRR